jgi:hypothetical protein
MVERASCCGVLDDVLCWSITRRIIPSIVVVAPENETVLYIPSVVWLTKLELIKPTCVIHTRFEEQPAILRPIHPTPDAFLRAIGAGDPEISRPGRA